MVRLRLGGASHRPWTGGLIALTLVGVHLTRSLERSIEVRLMALATAVGAIGEMVRIATVTYRFTSGTVIDALPPAWLLTTATKVRARRPSETGNCRPILDSSPRVCPESSPDDCELPAGMRQVRRFEKPPPFALSPPNPRRNASASSAVCPGLRPLPRGSPTTAGDAAKHSRAG
jgi:hypothetical protein